MGRMMALVAIALSSGACSVQPGLANAPRLGGTTVADPRIHDAIANGPDSCGRTTDPGILPNRILPCPASSQPRSLPPPAHSPGSEPNFTPWLEHFYSNCTWPAQASRANRSAASPTALAVGAGCFEGKERLVPDGSELTL